MDLTRFNLPINIRDFIECFDNSKTTTGIFSMLALTLPTKRMLTSYYVYEGGRFRLRERTLTHVWTKDIVERYYERYDNAHRDFKINLEMWDKIMTVVRKVVEEEYRAYRIENSHSLLLHASTA
jgi:hypothetical protein